MVLERTRIGTARNVECGGSGTGRRCECGSRAYAVCRSYEINSWTFVPFDEVQNDSVLLLF